MTPDVAVDDSVDDGHVPDVTSVMTNMMAVGDAHKMAEAHGAYIYDYYKDVDVIRALVHCLSIVMLLAAIVFWCVVWVNARYGHPYRCVSFVVLMVFSLVYHLIGLIGVLVYLPNGVACQVLLTLKAYADTGMYSFFFIYVILCIGVAMRRLESGLKFYILVVIVILLPLVLVIATNTMRKTLHPEITCDMLDDLTRHVWYDRGPKCFLLFGTICILSVLLYWIFCFDNSMFKRNRDFLLIRHSSATLMILVCYCFFLELYQIVFLSHGVDGEIKTESRATSGLTLTILMSAKGALAAFLLCFFDLEIFDLIHAFPCCPDLQNATVDKTWESRIRPESRVRFFDDSSDDNDPSMGGNPFSSDKESEHVLPQTQSVQRYGSVQEEEDNNTT